MISVDLFAGGGGASEGFARAIGRSPTYAINHDPIALAMHEANHPETIHICGDIFEDEPRNITGGRHVFALWASPDCRDHSRAKAGQPLSNEEKTRSSAKGFSE